MPKKTKADPTGQARNRNKGTRRLSAKLTRAERQVKSLFREIPRLASRQTSIVNVEQTTIYDYDLTPQEQQQLERSVQFILNNELLETQIGDMPLNWYWQDNVEPSYRQGTAEELNRFNQLISTAVIAGVLVDGLPPATIAVESVLLSEPYRQALNNVFVSNFQVIETLSERTSAQVMQQIRSGVQSGETPTVIAKSISERFDVSRSSAERISRTEINKTYNDAKLNVVDITAKRTGLRAGVIHISALTSTTRATHAARHGLAYTVADQLQWWNSGTNRINCLCSTESVLIDRSGKVVQSEFQADIKAERALFDKE